MDAAVSLIPQSPPEDMQPTWNYGAYDNFTGNIINFLS